MEKTIKMSFKNADGKVIIKDIPENLASLYKMQGWEYVKDISKSTTLESK